MKSISCAALLVVLSLCVIGGLAKARPAGDEVCEGKDDKLLPHPDSCSLFIQCSNGHAFVHQCAEGHGELLCFDPWLKQCTYFQQCACEDPEARRSIH